MIFGNDQNKGLMSVKGKLKVVTIGENGITLDDILVHDAHDPDPSLHLALVNMHLPDFPVVFGVIRDVVALVYDQEMVKQINAVKQSSRIKDVDGMLNSGNTWVVEGNGNGNFDSELCKKRR